MFGRILIVLAMFALSPTARAQHGGTAPSNRTAPAEAGQFNFLVGQWELVVKPAATGLAQRIHGAPKLVGVWKAWRALDGWGIEDELRITDASGNPVNLTHSVRFYDRTARSWKTSVIDVYRGTLTSSTGQFAGGLMKTAARGTDADGKAYLARGTFSAVSRDAFRFEQERSLDNGKSWKENLVIEAKRVSATASR